VTLRFVRSPDLPASWKNDAESQAFLREAEALIEGEGAKRKQTQRGGE